MTNPERLSFYSETELESKAQAGFPLSCPTLDLATHWDNIRRNLLIYRPPNQTVSKIHQVGPPGSKTPEARAVTWKPDGQFLAVGWSDGVVRLMGLENNKAAHHIPVTDPATASITHIAWATSDIAASRALPSSLKDGVAKEWKGEGNAPVDLPRELTFLEVETALPKISPLPTGSAGPDDDATVFTLRTGIEFLFQPPKRGEHDHVDVMVVGTNDGKLQLNIYDSFLIGSFPSPLSDTSSPEYMISHASSPALSTQALVFAGSRLNPSEVHIVPMDLPFISSSPINLSLLASKLTTLQKLLRYIKQTQLHMQVEWKNARELPGRFLRSVQVDLEEQTVGPRSIVPALYHTVVTGHAYKPVREWLLESLAERGQKRWDKAVVTSLESLRSLVHENYLPALERCSIILSRLRGLAQFHGDRDDIGFTATQVSRLLDVVSCLSLAGHKILGHVMDELEHFNAFSTWLRFTIDRLGSSSSASDDLTEKEATMNTSKVLTYIERYITKSPLDVFFDDIAKDDWSSDWDCAQDGMDLLPILDGNLQKHETGQPARKALLHVEFLVAYMTERCNGMFEGIAGAKKRSVRFSKPITLCIGHPIGPMDVRMCKASVNTGVIFAAMAAKEDNAKVHIFRTEIEVTNGISSSGATTICTVDLDRPVVDLQLLDDKTLTVLCSGEAASSPAIYLLQVDSEQLSYSPFKGKVDASAVRVQGLSEFQLPERSAIRPVRMEVHDKSDLRGEIPKRVCLLGGNKTTWYTFALPA